MRKTTTNVLVALFVVMLITGSTILWGSYLETRQMGWIPLRTAVDANDTLLDGTTTSYTYAPADRPAKAVPLDTGMCGADIYLYGTDAADETCNYKVWCYKETGPALLWCYGAATLGTAVTGGTTTYYVDTITVTTVHGSSAAVVDSGNNRVCVLRLGDMRGIKWVYWEVSGITGTSKVSSISALITGY